MRMLLWIGYADACGLHEKYGINYNWSLENAVGIDRTATRDIFKKWHRELRAQARMMKGLIGVIDTRVEVARA